MLDQSVCLRCKLPQSNDAKRWFLYIWKNKGYVVCSAAEGRCALVNNDPPEECLHILEHALARVRHEDEAQGV